MSRHGARDSTAMVEDGASDDADDYRAAPARPAPKRSAAARDPASLQAVAKRRALVRLADPDDDDADNSGAYSGMDGRDDGDGDDDDDDCFAIRSSLRVELEHERRKPRERLPANCWWLNCATGGGSSSGGGAARHGAAAAGQAGTPYMTRRTKEVRVKAVLGERVVRMIVQGSNVREGVRQMEAAGMLRAAGCHADTRYQMLAFE